MRKVTLLLLLIAGFGRELKAQEPNDSKKNYKNTVRFNLTNPFIFGSRSLIFGYERIINRRHSFSINLGQAQFPGLNLISSDSLKSKSVLGEKGINASVDYRFYLSKENKYEPPRGIYIGPYFSYNYFEKKNSWLLQSTNGGAPTAVDSKTSLAVSTVGFELGYQFVFWDRVSLDMILAGPGLGFYNLKASLANNLSEEDKHKFFEKLNKALADKFPGYSTVIDEGEFQNKGSANTTSLGFRYMVMVGYRF
jgi:hypothetical protein